MAKNNIEDYTSVVDDFVNTQIEWENTLLWVCYENATLDDHWVLKSKDTGELVTIPETEAESLVVGFLEDCYNVDKSVVENFLYILQTESHIVVKLSDDPTQKKWREWLDREVALDCGLGS